MLQVMGNSQDEAGSGTKEGNSGDGELEAVSGQQQQQQR